MNTKANEGATAQEALPEAKLLAPGVPLRLRIVAIVLRTLFIGIFVVLVARVSLPLNETIWSAYDTPGDLIRVVVGSVACLWMLFHVFTLPKDAEAYRTWIYLGLVVVPFALVCVIAF
jgi:hypothetical protein